MANIPSQYEYITHINELYMPEFNHNHNLDFFEINDFRLLGTDWTTTQSSPLVPLKEASFLLLNGGDINYHYPNTVFDRDNLQCGFSSTVGRIDITTNPLNVAYSNFNVVTLRQFWSNANAQLNAQNAIFTYKDNDGFAYIANSGASDNFWRNDYTDFSSALLDIFAKFCNIDLYVDGELWVKGGPITYTWQSVSSISGKNGILQSLVQIKEEALNDGEPVSEASVTSFDSLGNINIPSVIDEQMLVDPDKLTSITATYLIPKLSVGTYSKIQLWLKKKNIPTSAEDADYVVNLTEPTNILRIGSASVNRLQESTKYIAVVAVEDEIGTTAQSEPEEIVTGKIPGIFKIVIATSSGVKDELKEVIVVEKQ